MFSVSKSGYSTKPKCFIGFGGAGANITEFFKSNGLSGHYRNVSWPLREYKNEIQFIPYLQKRANRVDVKLQEIESSTVPWEEIDLPNNIKQVFSPDYDYVLLAGLGGYTGTMLIKKASEYLHQLNYSFISVTTLPLSFERQLNKSIMWDVHTQLQQYQNNISIDLNSLYEKSGSLSLNEFFQKADEAVYHKVNDYFSKQGETKNL